MKACQHRCRLHNSIIIHLPGQGEDVETGTRRTGNRRVDHQVRECTRRVPPANHRDALKGRRSRISSQTIEYAGARTFIKSVAEATFCVIAKTKGRVSGFSRGEQAQKKITWPTMKTKLTSHCLEQRSQGHGSRRNDSIGLGTLTTQIGTRSPRNFAGFRQPV